MPCQSKVRVYLDADGKVDRVRLICEGTCEDGTPCRHVTDEIDLPHEEKGKGKGKGKEKGARKYERTRCGCGDEVPGRCQLWALREILPGGGRGKESFACQGRCGPLECVPVLLETHTTLVGGGDPMEDLSGPHAETGSTLRERVYARDYACRCL